MDRIHLQALLDQLNKLGDSAKVIIKQRDDKTVDVSISCDIRFSAVSKKEAAQIENDFKTAMDKLVKPAIDRITADMRKEIN